ncbi:hypothetical protein TNCV_4652811 [Trichonephila clavipes]|nr:hypothetical protein TNCV_4652811 [Trichonephila clavipes]
MWGVAEVYVSPLGSSVRYCVQHPHMRLYGVAYLFDHLRERYAIGRRSWKRWRRNFYLHIDLEIAGFPSTSAAPWFPCKGAFIQDPTHGKPSMAVSAKGSRTQILAS